MLRAIILAVLASSMLVFSACESNDAQKAYDEQIKAYQQWAEEYQKQYSEYQEQVNKAYEEYQKQVKDWYEQQQKQLQQTPAPQK